MEMHGKKTLPPPLTPSVSETEDLAGKVAREEKDIELFQRSKLKGCMLTQTMQKQMQNCKTFSHKLEV